jgi:hypothetical protein
VLALASYGPAAGISFLFFINAEDDDVSEVEGGIGDIRISR